MLIGIPGDNGGEEHDEEDDSVPQELLLNDYLLNQLREESGRLKDRSAMDVVPADRLVRLIHLMLKNINPAISINPLTDPVSVKPSIEDRCRFDMQTNVNYSRFQDDDEDSGRLWMSIAMERIMRSVNAALVVLNIMTSKNMPKRIYMDDVIDKIVTLTKNQLQSTIFPSYDPVYRPVPKSKKGIQLSLLAAFYQK